MTVINFRITDQQHEWIFGAQGGRTGQWVIDFQTEGGWQSQVIVPDDMYTPDNVAALIADRATTIDAVGDLTAAETGA